MTSVEAVIVGKEGFDAANVLKNNFDIDKRVENIYAGFKTLSNLVTM